MAIDQATRLLNLTTPLGENELVLTSFSGREEMSRLFRFQIDMISDNNAIAAADIVGKNVTFSVAKQDDSPRYFNGFVSRFYAGDEDVDGRREYRAEVVPWLWFLTRTSDCRIFQNKKYPEIIEQVFQDLGFSDFELQVKGNHPTREYCVQYRETDFDFVSRLMEEEGIYYYFVHENGKHTLKIADSKSAYVDCEEKEVDYPKDRGSEAIEDHLLSWHHYHEFRTGKVAQTDYNFKTPSTSLMTSEQTVIKLPGVSKYEFYDYPGIYGTTGDGQPLAKVRMEEEEAGHEVVEATGLCKTFTPGGKFTVREHVSSSEEGKKFVITQIEHVAHEPHGYETGAAEGPDYRNRFTCIPDSVTFRPARATTKPFVRGPQTAVVVGPAGEEIYPDEFGRVKVQFYWDREGKKDENSSCWVRVSQIHAGKNFGGIDIPRIGEEVIVDFLEGDPDQPIIIGRVYNAEQMPPYSLPANKTQSGIKSRSSKGGGPDNFNEIRFEDLKGSEEMYIHAEKDQNTVVENDQGIVVGNDRSETIGRDRSLDVGRDKVEHVGRNKTIQVDAGHTETITDSMTINVGSSLTETVALNYAETVGVAMQLSVGAALTVTVGAGMAETVGGAKAENVGASKTENIGTNKSLSTGGFLSENIGKDRNVEIKKDLKEIIGGQHTETVEKEYMLNAKKINVVGKDEIQIKVGKAELTMKKNGDILLNGKKINIKGSGDVIIKGSKIKEN